MTERLPDTDQGIARAAALLGEGALVAFGTETVYGLGADATNAQAVAAIFAAKNRPHFNPLIAHYPDAADAFADVTGNDLARRLAEAFWPGPLTLVLPRRPRSRVTLLASAGLDHLAVRVPAHPTARALLRVVGRPVVAPSANPSGRISPTTAEHVLAGLGGRIAAVLDSGACGVGVESTVVDVRANEPVLLRPGGITAEAIEALVGPLRTHTGDDAQPLAPGMLASHYAPRAPLRLNVTAPQADEALLAFGPPPTGAAAIYQLSDNADLTEAASRLFDGLHALDHLIAARGLRGIAAMPIPQTGLGRAINDRLRRAAVA